MSRLDFTDFERLVDMFMGKIVISQSRRNRKRKTRKNDKVELSRNDYFNTKRCLIELMIQAISLDHPHAEMLRKKTYKWLVALLKEFDFKEVKELMGAYRSAVKRLNSES